MVLNAYIFGIDFSDVAYTVIRLKRATWKLRAEALRRYRERHQGSLDRAEQEIEQLFQKSRPVAAESHVNSVVENNQHHEEAANQILDTRDANISSNVAEGVWIAAKSHVDFSIGVTMQPTSVNKSAVSRKSAKSTVLTKSKTNPWENDDDVESSSLRVRGSAVIRQDRRGTGKTQRYGSHSGKAIYTSAKSKTGPMDGRAKWGSRMEVESTYDENDSVFDDQLNFEESFIDEDAIFPHVHKASHHDIHQYSITGKNETYDIDQPRQDHRLSKSDAQAVIQVPGLYSTRNHPAGLSMDLGHNIKSSNHPSEEEDTLRDDDHLLYSHGLHSRHNSKSIDLPHTGTHSESSLMISVELPTLNYQDSVDSLESGEKCMHVSAHDF